MLSWVRISGVIKIVFLELVATCCFAYLAESILLGHGRIWGCPPNPIWSFDLELVVVVAIGSASAWWLLRGIFRPRMIEQEYQPTIQAGGVMMQNPAIAPVVFPFATTSPWYVLADVLVVGFAALFWNDYTYAEAGCGGLQPVVLSHALLAVALSFPLLRLLAWYVLRLRTEPEAQVGAWKPIALIWAILAPFALIMGVQAVQQEIKEHRLPVIDAHALAGGLSAHPDLVGKYVRLRGIPKSPLIKCDCEPKDPNFCKNVAVLVDLGVGGEVVAHESSSGGEELGRRLGKGTFDEIGQLMQIPDPKADPYVNVTCGFNRFGPSSPIGRAYLKLETPF